MDFFQNIIPAIPAPPGQPPPDPTLLETVQQLRALNDAITQLNYNMNPQICAGRSKVLAATRKIDEIEDEDGLKAALEHIQAKLRSLQPHTGVSATSNNGRSFLEAFPLEIRNEIYELLLVNPFLATAASIHPSAEHGAKEHYNLSPAILRTCKQISAEATKVLYNKNLFIISGLGQNRGCFPPSRVLRCPVFRYTKSANLFQTTAPDTNPAFTSIQHLRVMISPYLEDGLTLGEQLENCRTICRKPNLKSVHIQLLSRTNYEEFCCLRTGFFRPNLVTYPLLRIIEPFKLLRNLNSLKLENLDPEREINSLDEYSLRILAQSSMPIVDIFKMYEKVLAYAQTFERADFIKKGMSLHAGHFRDTLERRRPLNAMMPLTAQERMGLNVFKTDQPHPVEGGLELAKYACDENNVAEFNLLRKSVLDYLEPQYQRIINARRRFYDFVKRQREPLGVLHNIHSPGPQRYGERTQDIIEGTIFLEDYAKSFDRDLTLPVRRVIRLYQYDWNNLYETRFRENALARVSKTLSMDDDMQRWKLAFMDAGADMEKQYLKIRKARKELFESDVTGINRGYNFDTEPMKGDEENCLHPHIPFSFGE